MWIWGHLRMAGHFSTLVSEEEGENHMIVDWLTHSSLDGIANWLDAIIFFLIALYQFCSSYVLISILTSQLMTINHWFSRVLARELDMVRANVSYYVMVCTYMHHPAWRYMNAQKAPNLTWPFKHIAHLCGKGILLGLGSIQVIHTAFYWYLEHKNYKLRS